MEITITRIRNAMLLGLITAGLTACSSSPAPWTQAEESPWQSKRDTEEAAEPVVTDTTYSDPVLLADPELEPVMMVEPEPAPAPEVIIPVVVEEDKTPEQEIMALPAASYAVQMTASKSAEGMAKFQTANDLNDLMVVKTDRGGEIIYVLVDIHPDRATANEAAALLESRTGTKPWVRSVAGLQKVVAQ